MPPAKKEELLKFQEEIEDIVWKYDITYTEAIVLFCEEHDFEIERVPKFISHHLKAILQEEAEGLCLLKGGRQNRLPF